MAGTKYIKVFCPQTGNTVYAPATARKHMTAADTLLSPDLRRVITPVSDEEYNNWLTTGAVTPTEVKRPGTKPAISQPVNTEYVTRADLDKFKNELLEAITGGKKSTTKNNKE